MENAKAPIAKGHTAVMASRHEPPKSLEFFPTPPWAVRALFRHVMPTLGVGRVARAWEPAAGEGHMAEVLKEFCDQVTATDIYDYGRGYEVADFLDTTLSPPTIEADWIITNPPFVPAERFALLGLARARVGVALLLRTQWIETLGRYEAIFRDRPPTIFAPFAERVPMVKGRWDPDASTATAYAWFVWKIGEPPRPPLWIPPGCCETLTRPDDRQRFAAWSLAMAEGAALFDGMPQ